MKTETNTPANMIAAAAQNAARKPSVSADGTAVPLAGASSVVETAIVERIAIPTAPPICCDVDGPEEAGLLRLRSGDVAIVTGTNANGSPSPIRRKLKQIGPVRAVDRDLG